MPYTYDYPRAALTVDCVVFGLDEAVLQTPLDKRNFRKKILAMGLLIPLEERSRSGAHRPAQLFRFDERKYRSLKARGFNFEL